MNQFQNTFLVAWALSPLSRWHQATTLHKVLAAAAGAGTGYYLHTRKGWDIKKASMAGFGVAYGASMVMHAPRVMAMAGAAQGGALPQQQAPAPLPEQPEITADDDSAPPEVNNVVPFPEKTGT